MILANTRGRLSANDLHLVVLLVSQGSAARRVSAERRLAAEGPDAILDSPGLFERLLAVRSMLVPSEALFFYTLVRHALLRAQCDDRELADYIAALLLEFGKRDRACRIDWNDDQQHRYMIDILADLEATDSARRFKVLAHLGNYALWLAGLYPDYIAARQVRSGGPDMSYYEQLGARGFGQASDHALADRYGLDGVFRTAADRFPLLRQALNQLSDRVLFSHLVERH
jgi:hypothetical protein